MKKKLGLNYMAFAKSPVVFVANMDAENIKSLSIKQITDIYTGKVSYWSELGPDIALGELYPIIREAGDSSLSILAKHIPVFAKPPAGVATIILYNPKNS